MSSSVNFREPHTAKAKLKSTLEAPIRFHYICSMRWYLTVKIEGSDYNVKRCVEHCWCPSRAHIKDSHFGSSFGQKNKSGINDADIN